MALNVFPRYINVQLCTDICNVKIYGSFLGRSSIPSKANFKKSSLVCPVLFWAREYKEQPYESIIYLQGLGLLQIDHHMSIRVLWHVYLLLMGLVLRETDSF